MDPNETLRLIRLTVTQMGVDTDPGVRAAHARELREYWVALDTWLSTGGFLPAEWDGPTREARHEHFYDWTANAWQCRTCDTNADLCEQVNPGASR